MSTGIIGGVGLTHLTVYEQRAAPDGALSGSPHVHGLTDEAYFVVSGTGKVELHDAKRGFRTVALKPGRYLQFPPCVMHRIISTGGLTILAVMGNAGLAEKGDARIYFGKVVDDNPQEFARLVGLAKEKGLDGALERRDAAVKAYRGLLDLWEKDRAGYQAELKRFIGVHLAALVNRKAEYSDAISSGPFAWGKRSVQRLVQLPQPDSELEPMLHEPDADFAYGMCGVLRPILTLKPVSG